MRILKQNSSRGFIDDVMFIAFCITILTLIIDTSIINIYFIDFNRLPNNLKQNIFVFIAILSMIGLYVILEFLKHKRDLIQKVYSGVRAIHRRIVLVQILIMATFALLIFEMIFLDRYYIINLLVSVIVNYTVGAYLLALLAKKFYSWFTLDKNHVLLLYGISFSILVVNMIFTSLLATILLMKGHDVVFPHHGFIGSYFGKNFLTDFLRMGQMSTMVMGFVSSWVSTIMLIRQFTSKWRSRYWAPLSLPLVYFLLQFQPIFINLFSTYIRIEPVAYFTILTLLVGYSKPIGGAMFGAAFSAISKKLSNNSISMNYTTISAYGFVLFFVSNQALILTSTSYPPFGLAATNFVSLSCYMLFVGIFASAVSLSRDSKLRISIRQLVEKKSSLLGSMGLSQTIQEIQKETTGIYKNINKQVDTDTDIKSTMSLSEAKEYCRKVIAELAEAKKRHKGV
jgi:hypothetical protein